MKKNSLLVFTLVLLFSISSAAMCFAESIPTPLGPSLGQDQFLFIDTHTIKNGIGDVGGGLMIDFPTYTYSPQNKILNSHVQIQGYSTDTKVIVGSGMSITGTAGGGAATGLKAYNGFSSEGLFFVDSDFTVHFFMEGDWITVALGETWTKQVEVQPAGFTGKFVYTYRVINYGVHKKTDLVQPTPAVTETSTVTPTSTPVPTSTPTAEIKKYKICGYVMSVPGLLMESDSANFKFEIPEIGLSAKSDSTGYFQISDVPELKSGTNSYTLKISKPGYLTRIVKNLWVEQDMEIGSSSYRISMLSGDINDDGVINMSDIFELAKAFNTTYTDSKFNKTADLNYDNAINMSDVMIIAGNFNKSSAGYTTPLITGLNYINVNANGNINISLREGGIAGITWKYAISDETIIKFISKTSGVIPFPDAFANSTWTFKALSKGTAEILFNSSFGETAQKYIVTVTDGTIASSNPSPTPVKEPELIDSSRLMSTLISSDSRQTISSGKNIVFCPTFQMAWDEFKNVIGGDILLSGDPPLASTLNRGFPMSGSLSPESYIAMGGFGQKTVDNINSALISKFGDSAPQLTEKLNDSDIIAYSYLWKNVCFAKAFDSISTPFYFKSVNKADIVKSFGIPYHSMQAKDLANQVEIYDYKSKTDFIVKLVTENDTDEIILAKTAPQENLYKTYTSVMDRINNTTPIGFSEYYDSLQVPVLDFNILHKYTELEGRVLQNPSFTNYFIAAAKQSTRFKLDEKGAVLASQATIITLPSIDHPASKELIFDGPFMVILKEKNATNPYLMIWVDNPELLSK